MGHVSSLERQPCGRRSPTLMSGWRRGYRHLSYADLIRRHDRPATPFYLDPANIGIASVTMVMGYSAATLSRGWRTSSSISRGSLCCRSRTHTAARRGESQASTPAGQFGAASMTSARCINRRRAQGFGTVTSVAALAGLGDAFLVFQRTPSFPWPRRPFLLISPQPALRRAA